MIISITLIVKKWKGNGKAVSTFFLFWLTCVLCLLSSSVSYMDPLLLWLTFPPPILPYKIIFIFNKTSKTVWAKGKKKTSKIESPSFHSTTPITRSSPNLLSQFLWYKIFYPLIWKRKVVIYSENNILL